MELEGLRGNLKKLQTENAEMQHRISFLEAQINVMGTKALNSRSLEEVLDALPSFLYCGSACRALAMLQKNHPCFEKLTLLLRMSCTLLTVHHLQDSCSDRVASKLLSAYDITHGLVRAYYQHSCCSLNYIQILCRSWAGPSLTRQPRWS
jgi:hypothetical protein